MTAYKKKVMIMVSLKMVIKYPSMNSKNMLKKIIN